MPGEVTTRPPDDEPVDAEVVHKPRRLIPGKPLLLVLGLLVMMGVAIQLYAEQLVEVLPEAGRAFANILLLPLILIGVVTLLCWLVFRSSYTWWIKILIVASVVSFPVVFKVQHSGDLFSFHLQLRWFAPDKFLELPEVAAEAPTPAALQESDPDAFREFFGPGRTGNLSDYQLTSWVEQPPELLWRKEVGAGWSGFVAANGLAVTQEQRGDQELVTAYNLSTGEVLWFHTESKTRFEEEMGGVGPRATPSIDGDLVFAQGGTGILVCLELATGDLKWRRDVVADVGSEPEVDQKLVSWGRSGSPLVFDNKVIVPGGGRDGQFTSLVAYDRDSGEEVWRGGDQQISYSSPVLMTLAGREQVVTVNESSVAGHDPQTGKQLWSYERTGRSNADANTSQPRQFGPNRLLVTKGYSLGAELLEVSPSSNNEWTVVSVWQNRRLLRTKLTSAIVHQDYAYGLNEGILECVSLLTGERVWKGGRYRHGQILIVGDEIIVLSEDGSLFQLPASPEKPESPAGIPAVHGITWNNLCLSGDYLLVRNDREAACFRVSVQRSAGPAAKPEEPSGSGP